MLMTSTLLVRASRCLLSGVTGADHLATTRLRLTARSHEIRSVVRADLSHVMRIVTVNVKLAITTTGGVGLLLHFGLAVRPAVTANDCCCHCSLLDWSRRAVFLHRLGRAEDANWCCLLSWCASHGDWGCAGSSSGRGDVVGLMLLGASGHLLLMYLTRRYPSDLLVLYVGGVHRCSNLVDQVAN